MRTLFKTLFTSLAIALVTLVGLTSCEDNEKYDFVFEMPGSIVTEPGAVIELPIVARNISSVSVSSHPDGWEVSTIDVQNWTVKVTAPTKYTAEDSTVEENGILKLTGYTTAGTMVTATCYLSLLNDAIDLSAESSNCYAIWQKDTRYTINVTRYAEQAQSSFTPDRVELAWQSAKDLIQYYSYDREEGTFTFFVGHEDIKDQDDKVTGTRMPDGSALIAAYNAAGEVEWSWHIWLTGSDIETTAIKTAAGTFMDRNLGAYANSNGDTTPEKILEGYGFYYQWGRTEPFNRPMHYNMANNSDKVVYDAANAYIRMKIVGLENNGAEVGTPYYAKNHPTTFILGAKDYSYNWIYSAEVDNTVWGAHTGKKGTNDPCPRGWAVPSSEQLALLDIDGADDNQPSAAVKDQFGWFLTDGNGVKMFMPGAGRRSFEKGVLTNMNNYEGATPVPWIGCYWTADAGANNTAKSLFFDLNTTRAVNNRYDAAKEMYRANAMQIRCVKIE